MSGPPIDTDFLPRTRAVIEADDARAHAYRILAVSPGIRRALYDLLHEEVQRLGAQARECKRGALAAKLIARADQFRALADELAR